MIGAFGFELEYPYFYPLLLLLLPLLIFLGFHFKSQLKAIRSLNPTLDPFTKLSIFCLRVLPLIVLFLVLFALMGPRGNPRYSDSEVKEREKQSIKSPLKGTLLIVVDTSASMTATDTSTKESRLNAAKELADEIIALSPLSYKALFALGPKLNKVVPRTMDSLFTRLMVKQLDKDEAGAGTDFLIPFEQLGNEAKEIPDPVTVILLSDGEDPSLMQESDSNRKSRYEKIVSQFQNNSKRIIPVYAIAFGTLDGGEVPGVSYKGKPVVSKRGDQLLKSLVKGSQGQFFIFEAENKNLLAEKIIQDLSQKKGSLSEVLLKDAQESLIWSRYFQTPLFIALLLFVVYLTLPRTSSRKRGFMGLYLLAATFAPQEVEWQKGAAIYNAALERFEASDLEKAKEILESFVLDEATSSYVRAKKKELEALIALEKRVKAPPVMKALYELESLYSLDSSEKYRCLFEKEKGYEDCPPSYFIQELKKGVKKEYVTEEKEDTYLSLTAYGLAWIDRVKLTLEEPSYYESFLSLLDKGSARVYKEALNNFLQKDFEESLLLFEREVIRQQKKMNVQSPEVNLEILLKQSQITIYDLLAIGENSESPIYRFYDEGNPLWGRLLLVKRLQSLQKDKLVIDNPETLIEWVIKEQELALMFSRVFKNVDSHKSIESNISLLSSAQHEVLETLDPFLAISQEFRENKFKESGCETAPWGEIIPLYEKGKEEALMAEKVLKKPSVQEAVFYQGLALETFKELLNLFKNHQDSKQASKAKETLSESIRLFQDFELSDRALKGKASTPIQTERPW